MSDEQRFNPGDRVCLKIAPNIEGKYAVGHAAAYAQIHFDFALEPVEVPLDAIRHVDPPEHPANKDRSLLQVGDRVTFQDGGFAPFTSTIYNPDTWHLTYKKARIIRVERPKWEDV